MQLIDISLQVATIKTYKLISALVDSRKVLIAGIAAISLRKEEIQQIGLLLNLTIKDVGGRLIIAGVHLDLLTEEILI